MNNSEDTPSPEAQRVDRTGLALVHEGERIFPAESSAARFGPLTPSVVNYYFPVEIEVIGAGGDQLLAQICDELRKHIEALVV
jgi:hypothetical protein